MQTGVDWNAPVGASVIAPGDGIIRSAERYDDGASVRIDHGNGYETTYSQLYDFGHNLGAAVSQGEFIGRVELRSSGKSGLYYQFIVNGRFVDPLRVRLPTARELDGQTLAAFQRNSAQTEATGAVRTYDLFERR